MASRRNRPTLYEVVHHSRRQTARPRPAAPPGPTSQPGPARPPVAGESALPAAPQPPDTPTIAPPQTELPTVQPARAQPAAAKFRWLNGVLEMQLPAPWLIVGVVALAAVFGLGLHSGARMAHLSQAGDPRDDLSLLTAQPPVEAVDSSRSRQFAETPPAPARVADTRRFEPAAPSQREPEPAAPAVSEPGPQTPARAQPPIATPPRPARQVEWLPGKYYVVVQHFRSDAARHAEEAQQYLAQNGVEAVLLRGSDIRLIIAQPFDSKGAAESTLNSIRKLGQKYDRGYSFADCYARVFKRGS